MRRISCLIEEKEQLKEFKNSAEYCIGTGRMGLALQKEYYEQLKLVQEEIGFTYIRGHGLFCRDMAIYQEYTTPDGEKKVEYNFTYLDRVMDSYQELGIKPFLELGFMPEDLAKGDQTVFYWKGNVTPPKDYYRWRELVKATLRHLMDRYGAEEAVTWPVEVWNEPNLPVFWQDADMEAYFTLFLETFHAVKETDSRFRVGGPAICGVEDEKWITEFLTFCEKKEIPIDFITRHHYTVSDMKTNGHYSYCRLKDTKNSMEELLQTRRIMDCFPRFRELELHITEFNTSYRPDSPLHDTNENAAYIAGLLSRLGEEHTSYSYWTFGDVFEESGVPFTPFHGGFGLVANGGIPKPTFWVFQFYKQLKGYCLYQSEETVVTKGEDGVIRGIVWNWSPDRPEEELLISLSLPLEQGKEYTLLTRRVDEECCNPLKLWHDMGEPSGLSKEQRKLIKEAARPMIASTRISEEQRTGKIELKVKQNGVLYFELRKINPTSDRGYVWSQVVKGE